MTADILQIAGAAIASVASSAAAYFTYRLFRMRSTFRQNQQNIQAQQQRILQDIDEFGEQLVTHTLKILPQMTLSSYAAPNFPRRPEGPLHRSHFERRLGHFTPEKEILSSLVVNEICRKLEDNPELVIILLIDGGSTVYPVFRQLCSRPALQFDRDRANRIRIVTNNLPGVSDLTSYGRIVDLKSVKTLFRCRVIGGLANAEYEAALGLESADELQRVVNELRAEEEHPTEVICVTTGNYVSLVDGILTRGSEHEEIKKRMIDISEPAYILAPLGKILPFSCADLNRLLGAQGDARYRAESPWTQDPKNLILVTTLRNQEYFKNLDPASLVAHFSRVQEEVLDQFKDSILSDSFDPMDSIRVRTEAGIVGEKRALREYEIPHRDLRKCLLDYLDERIHSSHS